MASHRVPHSKYFRHRLYTRIRHARKAKAFLIDEVAALASTATGQTVTTKRTVNTKAESLVTIGGNLTAADWFALNDTRYTFVSALTEALAKQTLTNDTSNVTAADTVTIDGAVYTFKTALTEVKAAGTLTNDSVNVTAADTVTVGANVYTFKTALTEAKALGTLTGDTVVVSDGDTVTIGAKVYTFQSSLTNVDGHVKIAGSAALSLTNLFHGINATGGVVGTDYATLMTANTQVVATNPTATTVVVTALAVGTASNAVATTETSTHLAWGAATLAGGVNSIANEVKVGAANTNSMTSLFEAINAGSNAGTDYSTATVVHPTVVATPPSGTTVVVTAKTPGITGNSIVSTETSSHLSWGAATLAGGVASIAREVLVAGSATSSMTNLFEAINAGANAGTDYSTATSAHPTVVATNPTATTVVATAKVPGTAANSIAVTETSTHLAWGAATLTGGVAVVLNQILIDDTAAHSRDNLMNAINAGAGAGTKYATGTAAFPAVVASASSGNLLLTAASAVPAQRGKDTRISKLSTNITLSTGQLEGPLWVATGHAYVDGEGPMVMTNSGGALPAGTLTTNLYVHVVDANTIALATSHGAMRNGDYMVTTDAGTGTQTLTRVVTAAGFAEIAKRNKPRTIDAATDVDSLR